MSDTTASPTTTIGRGTCGHEFRFPIGKVPDEVKCAPCDRTVGIWAVMNPNDHPETPDND